MSADHATAGRESSESVARAGETCAAPSCWRDGSTVRVGDREAVLCETHRKALLGVSS